MVEALIMKVAKFVKRLSYPACEIVIVEKYFVPAG